ncbi:2819_t:CDS:2 [Ambispora gerdemannii]|uniref:2819_t:CDS:1 n=1 Tax=Ambispora gerdemannii TaxID=144530 RepID=A0A9N9ADF8_9GLOM|nr:2819_t:CDS:2 [Ambispora gerdemannii]
MSSSIIKTEKDDDEPEALRAFGLGKFVPSDDGSGLISRKDKNRNNGSSSNNKQFNLINYSRTMISMKKPAEEEWEMLEEGRDGNSSNAEEWDDDWD